MLVRAEWDEKHIQTGQLQQAGNTHVGESLLSKIRRGEDSHGSVHFPAQQSSLRKNGKLIRIIRDSLGARFRDRRLIFVPVKFFSFFSWGEIREFRPTRSLQVVCGSTVGVSGWGEIR
jgi:hypothetical protein